MLIHEEEFSALGNRKILFNTGLSPAWDEEPFSRWIDGDNRCYCDTLGALGDAFRDLIPALEKVARDKDWPERQAFAQTVLKDIRAELEGEAETALLRAARDSDPRVREAAEEARKRTEQVLKEIGVALDAQHTAAED